MKYKILYGGDNNINYNNKIVMVIGPGAEKEILNNVTDEIDYIVFISGEPLKTIDYFNLNDIKSNKKIIIFNCFNKNNKCISLDTIKKIQDKNVNLLTMKWFYNHMNCNFNFDLYSKIYFTKSEIDNKIEKIKNEIKYSGYWFSTGFFCLLDIFLQNPKKIYIHGINHKYNKFYKNNYYYQTQNKDNWKNGPMIMHNLYEEFLYLKENYYSKDFVILDDELKWLINNYEKKGFF